MRVNVRSVLICLVLAMAGLGVTMVLSATMGRVESLAVNRLFWRQVCWVGVGLLGMAFVSRIDYHMWRQMAPWLLLVTLILLGAVFVPGIGRRLNGAARWIKVGPVTFQPSELAKFALVVVAALIAARGDRSFMGLFVPIMGLAGILAAAIVIEPDFGTAALLVALGLAMAFGAGAPLWCIFASFAPLAGAAVWLIKSEAYRKARMLAFLNPEKYSDTVGYHINQSLIALGSGGIFGLGLGASRQNLFFLPESSTDFIFAIIGEQLGLAGTGAVLAAYAVFVYLGFKIAAWAPDRFGGMLAYGITVLIGGQAIMNTGVVTACLPTKGISLPYISLGGSAVACMMAMTGVLANIAEQGRPFETRSVAQFNAAAAGAD